MHAVVRRNASVSRVETQSIEEMRIAAEAFRKAGKPFEIVGFNNSRVIYWCNWCPASKGTDVTWRQV
jgi:hypothetical protein